MTTEQAARKLLSQLLLYAYRAQKYPNTVRDVHCEILCFEASTGAYMTGEEREWVERGRGGSVYLALKDLYHTFATPETVR